jgi:HEAT repeat protein
VLDSVRPAVAEALRRLTKEERQTSRDPRMELLARVRETGDAQLMPLLRPLLTDADDAVAAEAASVMNQVLKTSQYMAAPVGRPLLRAALWCDSRARDDVTRTGGAPSMCCSTPIVRR